MRVSQLLLLTGFFGVRGCFPGSYHGYHYLYRSTALSILLALWSRFVTGLTMDGIVSLQHPSRPYVGSTALLNKQQYLPRLFLRALYSTSRVSSWCDLEELEWSGVLFALKHVMIAWD